MKLDSVEDKPYLKHRSINNDITEILRHHELAVKVISGCEHCKAEFKEVIKT